MSIKCSQCGLTNWTTDEKCKRCEKPIASHTATSTESDPYDMPNPSKGNFRSIAIIAGVLLGIMGLFWVIGRTTNARTASAANATSETISLPTPTPDLVISSRNVESAKQAIDTLYKLHSATEAGLNFMQYGERVLDAKADVDSALRSMTLDAAADRNFAKAITSAMNAHIDARNDWSEYIQKGYSDEGKQTVLNISWSRSRDLLMEAELMFPKR
jgi:hypothetical protein